MLIAPEFFRNALIIVGVFFMMSVALVMGSRLLGIAKGADEYSESFLKEYRERYK